MFSRPDASHPVRIFSALVVLAFLLLMAGCTAPTATPVPPTATPVPPTATAVPPSRRRRCPPVATSVPPDSNAGAANRDAGPAHGDTGSPYRYASAADVHPKAAAGHGER